MMRLICPCGEDMVGADEDELVERVNAHLEEMHPGRVYTREQILFLVTQ